MYLHRLFLALIISAVVGTVQAQGLRVEAQVYRVADDLSPSDILISSSVTLFHNGRVYDYIESADEVTRFDRAAGRFTILNMARSLKTTVALDQIRHLLDSRRQESERYLSELARTGQPHANQTARNLRFQLDPTFHSAMDSTTGQMKLTSPSWKYLVATHEWPDGDQVSDYLEYADWIAKLNYVLHPTTLFPEPRIALNARLRQESIRMPTRVTLDLRPDEPLVLRAEYKFILQLDPLDRNMVRTWETAAGGNGMRSLSFRRYQETVLDTKLRFKEK